MRTIRAEARSSTSGGPVALVALVLGVAALQFAVAMVASRRPADALLIVGALVLAASAVVFPRIVLVLALLATMFPQRVGPAALNLSVTDAMGVLGVIAAVRFVPWGDRRIRMVFGALAIYLGTLAVSLVANHPLRAVLEWGHRGLLFGGSVMIGVAIVRSGAARTALRVFMGVIALVAALAVLEALQNGFEPAYVFQLQKNHAGVLLATGFLVAFVAGRQLAWPSNVVNALRVLTLLGLAATQSRAAALGLVAALAVRPLLLGRRGNQRSVSIGVLMVAVALLVVSAVSLNANDLSRPSEEQRFNSINTRTYGYEQAIDEVWSKNILTGGGIRYFTDPARPYLAPHNLVISELAEAGVIGLVGLATLLTATVLALRRSRTELAVLGMMALVLRVTQGLADIFWVAGPLTVAIILVGMGLTQDPATDDDRGATTPGRRASRLPWSN